MCIYGLGSNHDITKSVSTATFYRHCLANVMMAARAHRILFSAAFLEKKRTINSFVGEVCAYCRAAEDSVKAACSST